MTEAFVIVLDIRNDIRDGATLCEALRRFDDPVDSLEDGYPDWHPAPYSFHGMLTLFLYRETTGDSYRSLTRHPELAGVFGLEHIPDESVLSRTWRKRFDHGDREFITASAHCLVKDISRTDMGAFATHSAQIHISLYDLSLAKYR
ncbi:hypothetical protein [Natrinema gelatinilyticum]|uniref:hypothetical protein n=1 Tax=Natrinema gelatinilyticum TaxID=2961571 RepID=UPI0020C32DD2|nr:hypothetical protein [Natrinema gelatinilyticum]